MGLNLTREAVSQGVSNPARTEGVYGMCKISSQGVPTFEYVASFALRLQCHHTPFSYCYNCSQPLPTLWQTRGIRKLRQQCVARFKLVFVGDFGYTHIPSGLGKERRTSWATSRPLDHGFTCYFGGHRNLLALPDAPIPYLMMFC